MLGLHIEVPFDFADFHEACSPIFMILHWYCVIMANE